MSAYDPAAHAWRAMPGAPLPGGLGVPWAKKVDSHWRYGLLTDSVHANPYGIVHGGILATFADHALSLIAWEAAKRALCTTIQLNIHFLDAVKPGEFIELHGEVTRRTNALVFLRGKIVVSNHDRVRDVGGVDGIWRVSQSG